MDKKERPKYLRWKCIDNFAKMDKSKMFYRGSYTPTQSMIDTLTPIFESIKQKYTKQLNDWLNKEKTHLDMCGGQYTFFFVLPKMLKHVARKYPFMNINFVLDEFLTTEEMVNKDYDIALRATYLGINENAFYGASKINYNVSRKYFDDEIFLAVSKGSLKEYDHEELLLKHHNILFGRLDETGEKQYLYSVAPVARENEAPKIVVDSYFMIYMMMTHNAGISMGLSSMHKGDVQNLSILKSNTLSVARRVIFSKRNIKIHPFSKIFFRILNGD